MFFCMDLGYMSTILHIDVCVCVCVCFSVYVGSET